MIATLVVIWGIGITAGTLYGLRYETTPGNTTAAPDRWPDDSGCQLSGRWPTLLMFVHPRCPCSRASLEELAILMTRCKDRVGARVLFMRPSSAGGDWGRTVLWTSAARIPGVVVQWDDDGAEQQRFGARVSGEVVLYQPDGELAFHGGITAGRGHAGDNSGRSRLESILLDGARGARAAPVFGCELGSPETLNQDQTSTSGEAERP